MLRLRFSLLSAVVLAALFSVQVGVAFFYREDAPGAIASLTTLGWLYMALAAILFILSGPSAWRALKKLEATIHGHDPGAAARRGSGPAG